MRSNKTTKTPSRHGKEEAADEEEVIDQEEARGEVNIDYQALPKWKDIESEWHIFKILVFEKDINICIDKLFEAFAAGYEPNVEALKYAKKLNNEMIDEIFAEREFVVNDKDAHHLEEVFSLIPQVIATERDDDFFVPLEAALEPSPHPEEALSFIPQDTEHDDNDFVRLEAALEPSPTTDYFLDANSDDSLVPQPRTFQSFSSKTDQSFYYQNLADFPKPVKEKLPVIHPDDFFNSIEMYPDRRQELFELLHQPDQLEIIVTDEDSFVDCLLAFPEYIDKFYEIIFKSGMMKTIIDSASARNKSEGFFKNLMSYLLVCSKEFEKPNEKINALYLISWHQRFLYDADDIWNQPDRTAKNASLEALNRCRFFTKGATMGAFQGQFNEKISTHIASFLDWREGARLAITCKAAYQTARLEEAEARKKIKLS